MTSLNKKRLEFETDVNKWYAIFFMHSLERCRRVQGSRPYQQTGHIISLFPFFYLKKREINGHSFWLEQIKNSEGFKIKVKPPVKGRNQGINRHHHVMNYMKQLGGPPARPPLKEGVWMRTNEVCIILHVCTSVCFFSPSSSSFHSNNV